MENKRKENSVLRTIVIIVLVAIMVAGFLWFDNFQTVNGTRADIAANQLLNSMTYLGQLPWSMTEYKLRAVLVCDGANIFVDNGKKYSTSAIGCGYYLADGVYINTVTNALKGEGYISFDEVTYE